MGDIIGILTLGVEFSALVLLDRLLHGPQLEVWFLLIIFLLLALISLIYWHAKQDSENIGVWRRLTIGSLILGVAFFVVDLLLGWLFKGLDYLPILSGSSGIILTFLVCPVFTMISMGGLVRALYITRIGG
jgi:hypothetical protein